MRRPRYVETYDGPNWRRMRCVLCGRYRDMHDAPQPVPLRYLLQFVRMHRHAIVQVRITGQG